MAECKYCQLMANKDDVIYEDQLAIVMLAPKPAVPGHVIVMPKQHFTVLKEIPDNISNHLFSIASQISSVIYEKLEAQGTNLLVNIGIPGDQTKPHFMINVIPRMQGDNLNLLWEPKQFNQQEFQDVLSKIKDKCDYIGVEKPKQEPIENKPQVITEADGEDYLFKQLERIP